MNQKSTLKMQLDKVLLIYLLSMESLQVQNNQQQLLITSIFYLMVNNLMDMHLYRHNFPNIMVHYLIPKYIIKNHKYLL